MTGPMPDRMSLSHATAKVQKFFERSSSGAAAKLQRSESVKVDTMKGILAEMLSNCQPIRA